jgi:hypothetical protein
MLSRQCWRNLRSMQIVIIALAVAGFASWVVAASSAVAMVRHRAEGVSVFYLATHGIAFFGESHFKPTAAPHRRRFLRAFAAFFTAVLGVAVCAVAAAHT